MCFCLMCFLTCRRRRGRSRASERRAESKSRRAQSCQERACRSFLWRHFPNFCCGRKSVVDSCCVLFSFFPPRCSFTCLPFTVSRIAFITASRVKLLWTSCEDRNPLVENMTLPLIASWHQNYFRVLEMFWGGFIIARSSIILQNAFAAQVCSRKHEHSQSL